LNVGWNGNLMSRLGILLLILKCVIRRLIELGIFIRFFISFKISIFHLLVIFRLSLPFSLLLFCFFSKIMKMGVKLIGNFVSGFLPFIFKKGEKMERNIFIQKFLNLNSHYFLSFFSTF